MAKCENEPAPATVLANALLNAGDELGLSHSELASVLGLHRTAISRMKHRQHINPDSKQGELALMLIRIYHALYHLTNNNLRLMHHFMRTPNSLTGQTPADQIQNINGLITVMFCVESMLFPQA